MGVTCFNIQHNVCSMSGGDDLTLGTELEEVNLCSLHSLLQWTSAPQPVKVGTCRDLTGGRGFNIAYFPFDCM